MTPITYLERVRVRTGHMNTAEIRFSLRMRTLRYSVQVAAQLIRRARCAGCSPRVPGGSRDISD